MKKILGIIFLVFICSINSLFAATSTKEFIIKDTNKIYAKRNMNYFIEKGYKLILQETRGIRTAYVLKKNSNYVGCRTESLSKKETCYLITLKNNK
tara:strand:+ start:188 stop:475 length:288 start_codon:yes stop_codon:yes gene_type:complete